MKKVRILFVCLVFLSGCSGKTTEVERGLALRTRLLQASSCSFSAEITADYGENIHKFSVDCKGDESGGLSFAVTAPESIAGITGIISENGGKLTFDETALCFELLADEQLSPVSASWIFFKTLRSGFLRAAGEEGELLRLTFDDSYEENSMTLDIWLGQGDLPQRAEILYDGKRILSLDIQNFEIL